MEIKSKRLARLNGEVKLGYDALKGASKMFNRALRKELKLECKKLKGV